ncbi:MAG: HAD-IA family hydrolase [Thermoleophilia bacterium]|nr:HAD-IA family hydrolase [Thermoleophilia bacterium]
MRALLVDYGGVLTTDVWAGFRGFCAEHGLEVETLHRLLVTDDEAADDLRSIQLGTIADEEFERRLAGRLGLPADGLLDALAATWTIERAMVAALRTARAARVPLALVSNSLGLRMYDRTLLRDLVDTVVISAEVGLMKPQPEIYLLAAERLGVAPAACVMVDDLPHHVEAAAALGMTGLLHEQVDRTLGALERLLDLDLRRLV